MASKHFPLWMALAVLIALQAQAQMPLPPSIAGETKSEPSGDKKPASKPRPKAAKPAEGGSAKTVAKPAPARGYPETPPLPRRIDRDEIADPYGGGSGGGGSRVNPTFTPSGRAGVGGRF